MPGRVVVVGSSNADMVARVDHAPGPGETVLCEAYAILPGGKGANQAVAAARMGGQVAFVACVGRDALGQQAVHGFLQDGIDVFHVDSVEGVPTGTAFIWVDAEGENRIVVASGANSRLTPEHVERARFAIKGASVLLCQLETPLPAVQRALEIARATGVRTILNPAPAVILESEILRLVDILTPNEREAAQILGMDPDISAAPEVLTAGLLDCGIGLALLTMGAEGVLAHKAGAAPRRFAAPLVQVVDTTAAGDVFNGALAAFLAAGRSLDDSVAAAVAAASLACARPGAQPSIPRLDELSES